MHKSSITQAYLMNTGEYHTKRGKQMKKFTAILIIMLTVFTMAFAQAAAETAPAKTYATLAEVKADLKTVTAGKLTVATSPDFAPYEFYAIDANGKPNLAGFDMDLAKYIANFLGLELEVIPMDFDGIILELQTKSCDLGLAGFSPDPTRKEAVDFSDIYYQGGQSFVCLKKNADNFKTLESLNASKTLKVGAQTGSIQVGLAEEFSADTDIVLLTKVTDIIAEVLAGTLDGAYIETAVAAAYAVNYPELFLAVEVPYEEEGSAAAISKGNAALVAGVNMAIAQALADGSMDAFVATANELSSGEIYEGLLD